MKLSTLTKALGVCLAALLLTLSLSACGVNLQSGENGLYDKKHDITYCATESGFSSMRTFYRVFREEFSCSPRAYLQASATKKDLLF